MGEYEDRKTHESEGLLMTQERKYPHFTCIQIEQPPKLYKIGPDWNFIDSLELPYDEIIPRTVVVDAPLVNIWLEKVSKTQKYTSFPTRLDDYLIDVPGLIPISREYVEFKVSNTNVSIAKIHIEDALEGLADIHDTDMGPLRALKLYQHNLLLTPDAGSEIISKLQPYLEDGKKANQEFVEKLRSIKHPNVELRGTHD